MTITGYHSSISAGASQHHHGNCPLSPAEQLYVRAARRPWPAALRDLLGGPRTHLQVLGAVPAEAPCAAAKAQDTRQIPVAQIVGSVEPARSQDFDAEFRPRNPHLKERWLSVAVRRQAGRALPPVDLVQVGERYFVVDGHHRVSVERALGSQSIQARVARLGTQGLEIPG